MLALLEKMFSTRFKITWDESVAQFTEILPWQIVGFCIALGSCLTIWIILYFSDCCFSSKAHNDGYLRKTRRCGKSAGRFFIFMSAIIIGTFGFWIACNTAGVSFWNILFAYGIATLIVSVAFNDGLRNIGAYIMFALTNMISEDMYIEFVGQPIEGRILEINMLNVRMEVFDATAQKYRIRTIPNVYFLSSPWDRDTDKEENRPDLLTTTQQIQNRLKNKLK